MNNRKRTVIFKKVGENYECEMWCFRIEKVIISNDLPPKWFVIKDWTSSGYDRVTVSTTYTLSNAKKMVRAIVKYTYADQNI